MFIVSTRHSETAPNLAFHLQNCEAGFIIPEGADYIVNYGRQGMNNRANLNAKLYGDKLEQLERLRRAGIKVPKIIFATHPNEVARYEFPLLARKVHHSKGKDIIFLKTRRSWFRRMRRVKKRQFFVKYIPKQDEFRVHVLGDKIAGISKKVKNYDYPLPHAHVWSRDRGWIQVDYNGEQSERLSELAIKSIKALELDFGAIDIILGIDGEYYVLEVNTAPRLNRRRRKLYTNFFRQMWKRWRDRR